MSFYNTELYNKMQIAAPIATQKIQEHGRMLYMTHKSPDFSAKSGLQGIIS